LTFWNPAICNWSILYSSQIQMFQAENHVCIV
jgi:hypothetical protein